MINVHGSVLAFALLLSGSVLAEPGRVLPLKRGYDVTVGTPCGQASHATLFLLQRDRLGMAKEVCRFQSIVHEEDHVYTISERCAQGPSGRYGWVVEGRTQFHRQGVGEPGFRARHCRPSQLPEPWRSNDIARLVR